MKIKERAAIVMIAGLLLLALLVALVCVYVSAYARKPVDTDPVPQLAQ
jgi:hypothetical protein